MPENEPLPPGATPQLKSLSDVQECLADFNDRYPRPGLGALVLIDPVSVPDRNAKHPGSDNPGVYLFFDANQNLLYVGKASCKNVIGQRVGTEYFYADGRAKNEKAEGVASIAAVALPVDRAFEAPAVEEYLISQLCPPRNKAGRSE